MSLLEKAGDGSVPDEAFNAVVDVVESGSGPVTAADIDSQAASDGWVLTADGAGNSAFEASSASPTFATPAVALGAAAAAGVATSVIRSDSTIVAFDSTSPSTQAFGDTAVVGTAAVAARRDHKHAMPATPTSVSGNAGTATALATARNIDGQSFNGTADITVIAPGTHAATSKNPPVDADEIPLVDSAASNVLKKLTWANLKATLKTYFDTLYPSGSGTSTGTNTGDVAFATNAVVLGTAAAAGAASTVMRSNDTIAAFDATSPTTQAFGDAAAVGVATVAARRDHKHAFPSLGTGSTNACAGNDSRLSDARIPTPGPVGGVIWTTVTKSADTSRSSTTTVAADPHLTFTPSAGLIEVEAFIIYANPLSGATPDLKMTIAEDGTVRGVGLLTAFGSSDVATIVAISFGTSALLSPGTAATNRGVTVWGWFVATGAAVSLWWAQNTSDGNPTVVRQNSLLRWRQIT